MKKLSATAKALYIIAKIASVCCIVGFCILIFAGVLLFAFNDDSMLEFTSLNLGLFRFALNEFSPQMIRSAFLFNALPAAVLIAFGWAVLRIILRILSPMKNGQPFDTAVSVNLRKLCRLTIVGGVLTQLLTIAAGMLMYHTYDFSTLFLNERITAVSMNMEVDATFVVLALIWYMLSCVFRYGEELQKQSDETL